MYFGVWLGAYAIVVVVKLLARAASHLRFGRWLRDVMRDPWKDNVTECSTQRSRSE